MSDRIVLCSDLRKRRLYRKKVFRVGNHAYRWHIQDALMGGLVERSAVTHTSYHRCSLAASERMRQLQEEFAIRHGQ